ncbi:hypothetical protein OG762_49905 (plasmid) [Streptomyces sp. NBC_01136]|uniref:hypothetical protein n=1 Tax=unclassified Streptomyces TaxID=2593676 RepID=UPI002F908F05|nr:hypothetical protein OG762_49905 [Streptomyces sp. NBC_01136]
MQPRLTEAPQDFSRFVHHRRDLTNPTLDQARHRAGAIGEAYGWTRWVAREVDRALVILLSEHQTGDKISYSQMSDGLRHFGLTTKRTAEILDQLDLLNDDRVPVFESWLSQLSTVSPTGSAATSRTGCEPCVTAVPAASPASRAPP